MYAVFLRWVVACGLVVRAAVVPDYDIAFAPDVMVLRVGYHHALAQLGDQLVAFLVLDPHAERAVIINDVVAWWRPLPDYHFITFSNPYTYNPALSGDLRAPALMFAFKGSDAINCFRRSGRSRLRGAHGRGQGPKTPVEQALMRGLVTA